MVRGTSWRRAGVLEEKHNATNETWRKKNKKLGIKKKTTKGSTQDFKPDTGVRKYRKKLKGRCPEISRAVAQKRRRQHET